MALILIVEDEADLLETLEYRLVKEGYETRSAASGQQALLAARAQPLPDLVLLDLMLPDIRGTEVCRQLRQDELTREIPVIMCTAMADEIDRVVGFEVGADDYVTKPYSVRELLLRVRAILRRAQPSKEEAPPERAAEEGFSFGCLQVDIAAHRVWVEGQEVHLTALEFRLLTTFHERRGRVQSRERLLSDVWGYQADVTTRTVDTHVKRLREKLQTAGEYIETVRGVGYRFSEQPAADEPQ